MRASNSVKSFRNFDGSLSHVWVSLDTAEFDIPITIAKNAFKFWYSLQLWNETSERLKLYGRKLEKKMNLLRCQFDELLQQRHSFVEVRCRSHLRHNPVLNLIEASYKNVEIWCDLDWRVIGEKEKWTRRINFKWTFSVTSTNREKRMVKKKSRWKTFLITLNLPFLYLFSSFPYPMGSFNFFSLLSAPTEKPSNGDLFRSMLINFLANSFYIQKPSRIFLVTFLRTQERDWKDNYEFPMVFIALQLM